MIQIRSQNHSKQNLPKRVIKKFLINFGIQVAHEQIGANIEVLLMRTGLVNADLSYNDLKIKKNNWHLPGLPKSLIMFKILIA